ncbi:MAG: trehalose utilization protein ThuA [Mesorhizobium sp.]|nr:MAG: trehalose utilization protein ThuA [Mesorhizobium sp.]
MVNAVVWSEFRHERTDPLVAEIYPDGLHKVIADALRKSPEISASVASLDEAEHGLSERRLEHTDVLLWWGHIAHDEVDDAVVDRVQQRVWEGMGLIVLHSGHFSKIFRRLMGTPCSLSWRDIGEREIVQAVKPYHPIARGVARVFPLEKSEMYGEPFVVPEPAETVFMSSFGGGEVFRSGMTFQRGAGRIFYFSPGHEAYPIYHDDNVQTVLRNAVAWAHNPPGWWADVSIAHNIAAPRFGPAHQTP